MSWFIDTGAGGGSSPSLAASNAEAASLLKLLFHLPALAAGPVTEPEVEVEMG